MSRLNVENFLETVRGSVTANKFSSSDKPNRLAIIDPAYTGAGNPRVTFEGEGIVCENPYAVLSDTYTPKPGERVLLVPVGSTYAILGPVQQAGFTSFNNDVATYMRKAHATLSGGGVKADTGTGISWSTRFITISAGHDPLTAASGFFDITMPPNATVITGAAGRADVTVAAGLVPLAAWDSLWYILPLGSANTSLPANFRIMNYTGAFTVPDNWMLVAIRNADDTRVKWGDGSGQLVSYYEEVSIPAFATVAGTWKTIIATGRTHIEGPASYNTTNGIWTCPVSGIYHLTAKIIAGSSVASTRVIMDFNTALGGTGIVMRDERGVIAPLTYGVTLSGDVYVNVGTNIQLCMYSITGVLTGSGVTYPNAHHISFRLISAF